MKHFAEQHQVINAATDASDFLTGTKDSDVYDLSHVSDVFFIINITTSDGTATARFTVHSVDDIVPTTTHGMPFRYRSNVTCDAASAMTAWTVATSSGFVTTAGDYQVYEIWARAVDLYAGDHFIKLNSTEVVDDPVGGGITGLFVSEYAEDIHPDSLLT